MTVTFSISEPYVRFINEESKRLGITKSDVLRRALDSYREQQAQAQLPPVIKID